MSDLVAFLRARLDEDEQTARRACEYTSAVWRVDDDEETLLLWDPMPDTPGMGHTISERVTRHIAHHDPARVLRDVDAKRRAVNECAYWNERAAREAADPPKFAQPGLDLGLLLDAMNPVLRALALAYADHHDYREEWRP